MEVFFCKKLEGELISRQICQKKRGMDMAKRIFQRLEQALAAETLADLKNAPGRWHELKYGRKFQIAVHLIEPVRMIFELNDKPENLVDSDKNLDWNKVVSLTIISIENYHD